MSNTVADVSVARPREWGVRQMFGSNARVSPSSVAGTSRALLSRALSNVRTGRFERSLSALTAVGAAVTSAEVFMSHDGASFGNKMMWWPVVIVPTAILAGIAAVFSARAARTVLPLASAAIVVNGVQGTYLHWRGTAQRPGGWTRYNMEAGPPMFAPLLASLVGGMGLLAAILRREGSTES